jgi:enoyl-CoA hydratase/carnithine racemase
MRMLLTGDMMSADDARAIGLLSDVAAPSELTNTAMAMAAQIATKSPATLKIGKEAFYQQIEMALPDAYDFASNVMVANMLEPDAEEGIGAFIEKREPVWKSVMGA